MSRIWLLCTLLFCICWAVGATLTNDSKEKFDAFYRKLILGEDTVGQKYTKPAKFKFGKHQSYPEKSTVFDYVYDKRKNGQWIHWTDTQIDKLPIPASMKPSQIIIPTNITCMQTYFMNLYLQNEIPMLIVGPSGTGKSTIVLNHLANLPKDKYLPNVINFSARSTSNTTQDMIMAKLDRRRKGVYGPAMGKKYVIFIDDLNVLLKEQYGCQPPIELLRQLLDHKYFYDLESITRVDIVDVMLMACMVTTYCNVSSRFLRHMSIVSIDHLSESVIIQIYTTILDWHLSKGYNQTICKLSKNTIQALHYTYEQCRNQLFLATPAQQKTHYVFNLIHFSKVVTGLMQLPASHCTTPDKFYRLWTHEVLRIFGDRLMSEDKSLLFNTMKHACTNMLGVRMEDFVKKKRKPLCMDDLRYLVFGDYLDMNANPRVYDEIEDIDMLTNKIQLYIKEYNELNQDHTIDLVTFLYSIEHVSRVCRILNLADEHAILLTMGGSGASEVSKLATYMMEYNLFEIHAAKLYDVEDWKNDVCKLMKISGGKDCKPTTFLFSQTQIRDEIMVEHINMLLKTGDVPNLIPSEEKINIQDQMSEVARKTEQKIDTTPLALYNFFIERVKSNLHVILIFSPVGNEFRRRFRQFPSLISCCTIDWFTPWPEDALEQIAERNFEHIEMETKMKSNCIKLCQTFHTTVEKASKQFYKTLQRNEFLPSMYYLDLLKTFRNLYKNKIEEIQTLKDRYDVGLTKLQFAADQVTEMSDELTKLKPQLEITSVETEKLMVKIEQDTVQVEATKEIVGADEALANEAAAASQAIKDDCESDLAEAIPALKSAENALATLRAPDITIVKSMKNPPLGVKLVLEAICIMKGIKSVKKPDPSGSGKMFEDWWEPSLKILGDSNFLLSLQTYDKDKIDPGIMKNIRTRFIPNKDFDPEVIKSVSTACEGLCKWVRAMEVYDRVIKIVGPKKAKLAAAEGDYAIQMEKLNAKRTQLATVLSKLQTLRDELAQKSKDKKELEDQIELCKQKLERAEKLIGGLGGEKTRWSETSESLSISLVNCIGDVLISSGILTYLGAFDMDYRLNLIDQWKLTCSHLNIPFSENYSLIHILGDPIEIRNWTQHGLPQDDYSVDNIIIMKYNKKWPLFIDPQDQINTWIKHLEGRNLESCTMFDENLMHKLELAISNGTSVLIENVDETLQPCLLIQNYYHRDEEGEFQILFNDKVISYNLKFRLYLSTRMKNPNFNSELLTRSTLINCMITLQGLQSQLLGIVVTKEKPDLESKKNLLILDSASNKKILKETEDKILQVISTSEGNILEDESGVDVLTSSKLLSKEIEHSETLCSSTLLEISIARNLYNPVAYNSSVIWFCIATQLVNLSPMYMYSIQWYIDLYRNSIEKQTTRNEEPEQFSALLNSINDDFTYVIYKNITRSLFKQHKLVFTFVLSIELQRSKGKLEEILLQYFLSNVQNTNLKKTSSEPKPVSNWLPEPIWYQIVEISKFSEFKDFKYSIKEKNILWENYYNSTKPEMVENEYLNNKSDLYKLNILKILRPDRIKQGLERYVSKNLGPKYIQSTPLNLQQSYTGSTCRTPLMFILSPGANPVELIIQLSQDLNLEKPLTLSLGQGQEKMARSYMKQCLESGHWIILENCHIAISWMKLLEEFCSEMKTSDMIHNSFRLWLTSYPCATFPVSILEDGIKMVFEIPEGIKESLEQSYNQEPITNEEFSANTNLIFQRLLFSLCLFHAVLQERKQYGAIGWNVPYEFNQRDINISIQQLNEFIIQCGEENLETAIIYCIGECNYGGKIIDVIDERLLKCLIRDYSSTNIIGKITDSFSTNQIQSYIEHFHEANTIEFIGLNNNAEIMKNKKQKQMLLENIILTQSDRSLENNLVLTSSTRNCQTEMNEFIDMVENILNKLPGQFYLEMVEEKYPRTYDQCMNSVLCQELSRYNCLTETIKTTLKDVKKAVTGEITMSSEMEDLSVSLMSCKIPKVWLAKSYPSIKPLASYIEDLIKRLIFFQHWIDEGIPFVFWIPGFYFTLSFFTSLQQNHARQRKISIEEITMEIVLTQNETNEIPIQKIDNGVYCEGLYLEGARWNRDTRKLDESLPNSLYDPMPIICFKPCLKADLKKSSSYECPVYQTTERRGVLSTTAQPNGNFTMWIVLPTEISTDHWIKRGVAAFCQVNE